ncbi:MAG: nucleotidyltransferase domain-containing protein [Actinomycetota bacterium]
MSEVRTLGLESTRERDYLRQLLEQAGSASPVVLIGSHARGRAVPRWSDVDLLVIGERPSEPVPPRLQVMTLTQDELVRRVNSGDDFAQWALRYGQALSGFQTWARLRERLLASAPWPRSEPKYALARKKLLTARDLLAMGDLPAAEEETRFALAHLARGILLDSGEFPLSRPELDAQLERVGSHRTAHWLKRSNTSEPMTQSEIVSALRTVESQLQALS